jgi:hypothetical protein
MIADQYEGNEPPDKFDDPIGYAIWFEKHACPSCNGTGYQFPESCAEAGRNLGACRMCCGAAILVDADYDYDPYDIETFVNRFGMP